MVCRKQKKLIVKKRGIYYKRVSNAVGAFSMVCRKQKKLIVKKRGIYYKRVSNAVPKGGAIMV